MIPKFQNVITRLIILHQTIALQIKDINLACGM